MPNSNGPPADSKAALKRPDKPYKDFPLSPHPNGKWQKRIRGRLHYFGQWAKRVKGQLVALPYEESWKQAHEEYEAQKAELHAGRTPATNDEGMNIADLCNKFLRSKLRLLQSEEIGARFFAECRDTTDRIVACFGKHRRVDSLTNEDFEQLRADLAARYGKVRLGNEVVRVRSVFKHGKKRDLVPDSFRKPKAREVRRSRREGGKRLFTVAEINLLFDGCMGKDSEGNPKRYPGADVQMRAMILLGLNCGFGNSDVADLPRSAVDLKGGWIDFPRPKTEIERRCPLWPETIAALKAAIADRPKPLHRKADGDCVFLTQQGRRWVRVHVKNSKLADGSEAPRTAANINAVGNEFGKLLRRFGINGRRGLNFYSLRHTFRTIADASKDQPAIRYIMGHADGSIDDTYRESIDDARLVAVVEHVRRWLFGDRVK